MTRAAKLLAGIALAATLLAAPAYAETGIVKAWPKAEAIKKRHHELILDDLVQSFPQFIFIGGVEQPERATLIGSEGAGTVSSSATRNATLTVPSGTTLMVVYFACRHGASAATHSTWPTFNSVPMAFVRPVSQYQTRLWGGFFYVLNPATGANTFNIVMSSASSNSYVHAWYFGGNIYKPFGTSQVSVSTAANTLTCTHTCENDLPYVIAGCNHAHASGTGAGTWTGTNLTVDDSAGVAGNNSYCAASNASAVATSTGYQLDNSWGASYMQMFTCEVRRVYAADVTLPWRYSRFNNINGAAHAPGHEMGWMTGMNPLLASASDLSNYVFNDVRLGQPHPNRRIWAIIWVYDATDPGSITVSGTIGGEAITAKISGNSSAATGGYSYLVVADVPDGNTGTVDLTFSAAVDSCDVLVFPTYNYSDTLRDSVVGTSYTMSNLDVATGDFAFCVVNGASDGTGFGNAPNWTGTSSWVDHVDQANSGSTRRMGLYAADITETNDTNDLAPTGGGTANNCFAAVLVPA